MIPDKITIHCSDSPNNRDSVDAAEIRRWHLARGFKDIGYHYVVLRSGEVQKGRPDNEVGAHVEGHNTGNLGICLVGQDRFTDAQFQALRALLDRLMVNYVTIPHSGIYCHNQFDTAIKQGKTCPNMDIGRLMPWYFTREDGYIEPYLSS